MLTKEETERLTRVGRGTPMGEFLRRHWVAALMSEELSTPDGPPKRIRLFGEDLVAFRDSLGSLGILDLHCPHRGAALDRRQPQRPKNSVPHAACPSCSRILGSRV